MQFNNIPLPTNGARITVNADGSLAVPANPIVPFIEGDGIGSDITRAMKIVVDAAVRKAYDGAREIAWYEVFAGEKARENFGEYLPADTVDALRTCVVSIKGPLATPVGGGVRSLNVTLRQVLDLYACVRPVRHYPGVPSPVKDPDAMDVVIFRENSEDVYMGIEWKEGSPEARKLIDYLAAEFDTKIREDSGVGIKPISVFGTKRLVRMAMRYAIDNGRKALTLMHKGNIMKYTEGAFREWGYDVLREEFANSIALESELDGAAPAGKILVNDRIADSMFQQILTRTADYDVVATPNLNGDYFSDACAAQVGGLGMAPGANIGDGVAMFEATHGTAPKYANQNKVNPGSLILSAKMALDHLGWTEAAALVEQGVEKTIEKKIVTYDLERQMDGAKLASCSGFADAIVENL